MTGKENIATINKHNIRPELEASIVEISKRNEEPTCLKDHRIDKLKTYLKEPFPDKVLHLWRYSDPISFDLNGRNISIERTKIEFNISREFVDRGVILTELENSFKLSALREKIKNAFGGLISLSPNKFTYLNDATWNGGYFLYIPKGLKVDKPMFVKLKADGSNKFEALKILILVEEDASVDLIEEVTSIDANNSLVNIATEVYLSKGANLNYLNLQTHAGDVTQHLFQRVSLEKQAKLTNLLVLLGGKNTKSEIVGWLKGEQASLSTYGIVLGDESQKFDSHTSIFHEAPFTKSLLNFRVALKGKARSAYTGNLKIAHSAIKSDAIQENRNLLLSKAAKAESIPELEILTNDVIRCSHGVTVGQVDKDQIYYLMSRGLSEKEAERIIIEGFFEPTVSRFPDENLKEEIAKIINKKLENL